MPTSGLESPASYRARLERDLKIAERVHRSMIPANQRRGHLEIACAFEPMNGVGGDYASVHFQDDRHVVVGICDVAGHGVAAALLASRVNSFVLNLAPGVRHPCQIVDALNDFVWHNFRETELYLTFFSLFINLDRQVVMGAGCGHPPPLLYLRRSDAIQRLESEHTPIGLFEHLSGAGPTLETPFSPGDRLVLYTDGLTESTNRGDLALGVGGLEQYVKESARQATGACVEAIRCRVNDFKGGEPNTDDQLLLAISYLDSNEASETVR